MPILFAEAPHPSLAVFSETQHKEADFNSCILITIL
jgi:hypothetical protein